MATRAYALRAEYSEVNSLGTAGYNGESLDVGKLLADGNGTIVTEDERLIAVLDEVPYLKRTSASGVEGATDNQPSGDKPSAVSGSDDVVVVSEQKGTSKSTSKGTK